MGEWRVSTPKSRLRVYSLFRPFYPDILMNNKPFLAETKLSPNDRETNSKNAY